jgi:hypothetical protein
MTPNESAGKPRLMTLPHNLRYPDYKETHLEDEWCAKAGCVPVCDVPGCKMPLNPPCGHTRPAAQPLVPATEGQAGIEASAREWAEATMVDLLKPYSGREGASFRHGFRREGLPILINRFAISLRAALAESQQRGDAPARYLTKHQKEVEEAAGMPIDWGMANAATVAVPPTVEGKLHEIEVSLNELQADPHMWSTQPCSTCSKITLALGKPFGCVLFAQVRALAAQPTPAPKERANG